MKITFEKAIELLRDKFKEQYIVEGFEYKGQYVFRMLSKQFKTMRFNQSFYVSIGINDGEIYKFDPIRERYLNFEVYNKALKSAKIIDKVDESENSFVDDLLSNGFRY